VTSGLPVNLQYTQGDGDETKATQAFLKELGMPTELVQ
jgi:hypothetical protein